jgi:FkbM family methyltransferase
MKGSKVFGGAIAALGWTLALPFGAREGTKIRAYASERLAPTYRLETPGGPIFFACPSRSAARMPMSFFHHEPETARWIDSYFDQGECMWDVGANIGHFSLYAARSRRARIVAFEPSAQTFGVLYQNVALNGLGALISAYCIALSDRTELSSFFLQNATAGEAMHALGTPETLKGSFTPQFVQTTISTTVDDFIRLFQAPAPDHIKIDVDGSEDRIIAGAERALKRIKTVLVELDRAHIDPPKEAKVIGMLGEAGLREDTAFESPSGWNRLFVRA